MIGLLEGIRVVETGVLLSVDNLGSLLGDAGADVIKVEAPGLGDYLRNIGPALAPDCSVAHLRVEQEQAEHDPGSPQQRRAGSHVALDRNG